MALLLCSLMTYVETRTSSATIVKKTKTAILIKNHRHVLVWGHLVNDFVINVELIISVSICEAYNPVSPIGIAISLL